MKQTRNGMIDVLKFLFCLLIAVFHFYGYVPPRERFTLGSIGVEFFVLASGIFIYAKWDKERDALSLAHDAARPDMTLYPWGYAKNRFLRFFPFVFPATLIAIFSKRFWPLLTSGRSLSDITLMKLSDWFSTDFWEMIMIKICGINHDSGLMDGPLWTIEAMLIVEVFILCILVRNERAFTTFIAPFSILSGYGFWRNLDEASNENWIGLTTFGILHVYLIMCCAIYSYKLSKTLKKTDLSAFGRFVLTIAELVAYAAVFGVAYYGNSRYYRYLLTLILTLALAITISGVSYTSFRSSRLTRALAEVSFGVYVIHYPVIAFYSSLHPHETEPPSMVLTVMGLIVGFAAAYTICVKILWKAFLTFCAAFGRRLTNRADPDGPDGSVSWTQDGSVS